MHKERVSRVVPTSRHPQVGVKSVTSSQRIERCSSFLVGKLRERTEKPFDVRPRGQRTLSQIKPCRSASSMRSSFSIDRTFLGLSLQNIRRLTLGLVNTLVPKPLTNQQAGHPNTSAGQQERKGTALDDISSHAAGEYSAHLLCRL